MTQHVFVYGDLVGGFGFIGPVEPDDGELEAEFDSESWWYAEMDSRAEALWKPGNPDPETLEEELSEAIWSADDLFQEDGSLEPGYDLAALLALRDIISIWRMMPEEDE